VLVGRRTADRRWPVLRMPGHPDQARTRLDQQVLARLGGLGPAAAEAGGRGIDDVRLAGADLGVTETEALQNPRAEVLDHHVGALDQAVDDLAGLGVLEVDGEQPLVAVGAEVERADTIDIGVGSRPVALEGALGRLDLDYIGAHVGQILGRCRTLQIVAEAHHPHVAEHGAPLLVYLVHGQTIASSLLRSKKCR